MKKTTRFLAMLAICATMLFTACNDDDDIPALEYSEQGFVKGTIKGTSTDGKTTFNEEFNYSRYSNATAIGQFLSHYSVDEDGEIDISIVRQDLSTGGYVSLELTLDNDTDTTPDGDIGVNYIRENENILYFQMSSSGSNDFTITNFSFNKASGQVKGDYSLSGDNTSTDRAATITGSFDVTVKQVVN